ncbi:MAG: hypothetical protein Kow00105_07720 [Phycisphaeraceae bacterium]
MLRVIINIINSEWPRVCVCGYTYGTRGVSDHTGWACEPAFRAVPAESQAQPGLVIRPIRPK